MPEANLVIYGLGALSGLSMFMLAKLFSLAKNQSINDVKLEYHEKILEEIKEILKELQKKINTVI
jgi:hypothetical protein